MVSAVTWSWSAPLYLDDTAVARALPGAVLPLLSHSQALLKLVAYERFFPYLYAIKTQRKARNAPSRGLWVP